MTDQSLQIVTGQETLGAAAHEYARHSKSESTLYVYRHGWSEFVDWCDLNGRESMPASPGAVADFLAALAKGGAKPSTIALRRCAIGYAHRTKNVADPTSAELVSAVMSGITRQVGVRPDRKAPLVFEDLRPAIAALPDSISGTRDRAILLIGFAAALRRSELVGLNLDDLTLEGSRLTLLLRRSKTDQAGAGSEITIPAVGGPMCPVQALRTWLDTSGISSGPLFRKIDRYGHIGRERLTGQSVRLIVKAAAKRANLDHRRLSAHSLRAGFATSAVAANVPTPSAMLVTRHKSVDVFQIYNRGGATQQIKAIEAIFTQ